MYTAGPGTESFPDVWCSPEGWRGDDPYIYYSYEYSVNLTAGGDTKVVDGKVSTGFLFCIDISSIYHRHIEHFFTFLVGNTVFSLVSESPR